MNVTGFYTEDEPKKERKGLLSKLNETYSRLPVRFGCLQLRYILVHSSASSVTHYCEATCELKDKLGDLSLPVYAKLLNDSWQREFKRENCYVSLLTFIHVLQQG